MEAKGRAPSIVRFSRSENHKRLFFSRTVQWKSTRLSGLGCLFGVASVLLVSSSEAVKVILLLSRARETWRLPGLELEAETGLEPGREVLPPTRDWARDWLRLRLTEKDRERRRSAHGSESPVK